MAETFEEKSVQDYKEKAGEIVIACSDIMEKAVLKDNREAYDHALEGHKFASEAIAVWEDASRTPLVQAKRTIFAHEALNSLDIARRELRKAQQALG